MSKSAVIYWSGTGNTEAMAQAVLDGLNGAGEDAALFSADSVRAADAAQYDKLALGCPAMSAEVLEESVFEPIFTELEPLLSGKKVALFGSYGWGDGEWMRIWEETCTGDGAVFVRDSVICNDAPDDNAIADCKALGAALV
mgnify:CR=1 FL=1